MPIRVSRSKVNCAHITTDNIQIKLIQKLPKCLGQWPISDDFPNFPDLPGGHQRKFSIYMHKPTII